MIKRFFSNNYVTILAVILLLGLLGGAAALLLPATEEIKDNSSCLHGRYKYLNTYYDEDGNKVYGFTCLDCRASIRETPATSSFVLNKPTLESGVVVQNAPWEVGAFYVDEESGEKEYRLFTRKTDDWLTDDILWTTSTGIRVNDYRVNMIATKVGSGAITYVAEKSGYVRPYFQDFKCETDDGYGEFAILLNGERVLPADGNFVLPTSASGVTYHEELNTSLADAWIYVEKGDKLSFTIYGDSIAGYEYTVHPVVEIMTMSPARR